MNSPIETKKNYYNKMREKGKSFYVYLVLRILVILTAVRCIFEGNYESFMLCILSLVLFTLPAVFQEKFKIVIPPAFEIIIYLFIYAAEILGEVNAYYTAIPGWDTMLHTLNGFLAAAIGFSMIDLLNRNSKSLSLSPFYQAMMAFCFSMTIGVVWEFFEFTMDQLFYVDMQKDFIVKTIASVTLDPQQAQNVIKVPDIVRTMIETADGGRIVVEGGYLDIGILDTMKDLMVNFLGAIVFSVFGYIFVKNEQKGTGKENIAGKMKLSRAEDDEADVTDVQPKKTRKPQSAKPQTDGNGEGRAPKKKAPKSGEGEAPKKKVTKSEEGQAPKKKVTKSGEGQAPKKKAPKSEEGQAPKKKVTKSGEGETPKKKAPKSGEGQASEKKVKKSGEGQVQETLEKTAPKKKVTKTGDAAEQSTSSSKKPAQKSGNTQSSKKPAQKSGNTASSKPKTRKPEENTKPKAQKPENEKPEDVKAEEALQEPVISVQVLDETVSAETKETKTENEE